MDSSLGLSVLDQLAGLVEPVDRSLYEQYERIARERIDRRDLDDWPVVAVALLLRLPIWTEDQDFFGSASQPGRPIEWRLISESPDRFKSYPQR